MQRMGWSWARASVELTRNRRTLATAVLLLAATNQAAGQGRAGRPAGVDEGKQQVHRLNNEVLRLYSRSKNANRGQSDAARTQLLARRQAALLELIQRSPEASLESALPPGIAAKVAAAFAADGELVERYGVVAGIYEVEIEDREQDAEVHRFLHSGDRTLTFYSEDSERALKSGSFIQATGMLVGDTFAAGDVQTPSALVESAAAAPGAGCSTTGAQRIAVLKVRPPGSSASLSNANIADWIFGSSGITVSRYWQENSNGAAWAEGDVYPAGTDAWYTLDREYSCTESSLLRAAALSAANATVNFNNYNRVIIVFPLPSSGCSFAGRASVGCWLANPDGGPSISYSLQVRNSMTSRTSAVQLTTHEAGHMLGLYHASTVDYGAEALGAPSNYGTRDEYGDRYSAMGFWDSGHYAAPHKKLLGWIDNYLNVTSGGTYRLQEASLAPNSSGGAMQALELKRGSGGSQTVWVEFRRRLGDFWSSAVQNPANGALLHLDNGTGQSLLLDFTPSTSTFADSTLNVGQSWTDPYSDLSLSVESASDSGLDLEVAYGVAPCVAADPTVAISPPSASTEYPAPASYQATVTNNDNAECDSASFSLSSGVTLDGQATPEVDTSLSQGVLTLAPGGSSAVTLTATPAALPAQTTSYALSATASRAEGSATGEAGLVVEPPAQLELSSSSAAVAAVAGEAAPATAALLLTSSGPGELSYTAQVVSGGTWLSVSPASGTTPATLTVAVDASQILSAATLQGSIEVESESGQVETISVSALVAAPPAAVAAWSMGEATPGQGVVLGDGSGNGHSLTTVGRGSAPVSGVSGSARVFNGYRDDAVAAGSADFTPQRFTARAWVRLEALPPKFGVVMSAFGGANYQGWFIGVDSAGRPLLMAATPPSSSPWLTAAQSLAVGRWYMLTATFDRTTNRGSLYIDASLATSAIFPGLVPDTGVGLTIAKASWTDSYHLNAAIDEAEIAPYARSALAVAADYATFSPPPPIANSAVGGQWSLDDGVEDSSGNGHDATHGGGAPGPGVLNGGRRFDGFNDYAAIPTSERLSTADFTLRAWVRLLSAPNGLSVMVANEDDFTGWYLGMLGDRRPFLGIASKPSSVSSTLASTPLPLDAWTALTVTYDGAERRLSLYVNGQLASSNFVAGLTPRTTGDLTLGRASWADAHYTHMDLDELLVLPQAWSAQQVADDYASFAEPADQQPVAYWRFDDAAAGAGTQLSDTAGSHAIEVIGSTDSAVGGQVDGAHRFGGWPGYGTVPTHPDLATSSFSFATWLKIDAALPHWGAVISSYDGEYHGWYWR